MTPMTKPGAGSSAGSSAPSGSCGSLCRPVPKGGGRRDQPATHGAAPSPSSAGSSAGGVAQLGGELRDRLLVTAPPPLGWSARGSKPSVDGAQRARARLHLPLFAVFCCPAPSARARAAVTFCHSVLTVKPRAEARRASVIPGRFWKARFQVRRSRLRLKPAPSAQA